MSEDKQKLIFSKNLNSYIENSGKTQLEIAKNIGVSPQTFNTWCKGIAIPRMGKVQSLADYFHISKSDLIDEHANGHEATNSNSQDPDIRRIERARQNMPEADKKFMMDMLTRSFAEYFEDDGSDDPD